MPSGTSVLNTIYVFWKHFSLEFGFTPPDQVYRRQLLERAIFCLDSLIAQKVYKLEESRTKEERQLSGKNDSTDQDRLKIYERYVEILNKSLSPRVYLLLGHYQLLLNFYDDALSAYTKYESLADETGRQDVAFLYGLGLCCFHFSAFHRYVGFPTVSVFFLYNHIAYQHLRRILYH